MDVIGKLADEENAQCVIMLEDDRTFGDTILQQNELNFSLALTVFKSGDVNGEQIAESGKSCPFYIMHFQNMTRALEFLHINKDNIRLMLDATFCFLSQSKFFTGEGMGGTS